MARDSSVHSILRRAQYRHFGLAQCAASKLRGIPAIREASPDVGYVDETCTELGRSMAVLRKNALRHDCVNMGIKVDQVSERRYGPHHGGHSAIAVNFKPENVADSIIRRPAELAQE
jgi:hypothetical protein